MKTKKVKKSIQSKITLSMALIIILVFVMITGVISFFINSTLIRYALDVLDNSDKYVASMLDSYFQRYVTIIEQVAQDEEAINLAETSNKKEKIANNKYYKDTVNALTQAHNLETDSIISVYVVSIGSEYVCGDNFVLDDGSLDVKSREWYSAYTDSKLAITEPYIDVNTGKSVVTIAVPMIKGSKVVGIAAIDMYAEELNTIAKSSKPGKNGYYILLTQNNTVISHADENQLFKNVNEIGIASNMLKNIENNNSEKILYKNINENVYGGYLSIGDTGWKIVSVLPQSEIKFSILSIIILMLLVFAIGLVVLLVMLFINIKATIKPLKKLTIITNKLAEGDLDVNIDVKSNDEIGVLAESLTGLTSRLKEYIVYIDETTDSMNKLANGELSIELEQAYNGEFSKVKEALLNLSSMLKKIIGNISETANQVYTGASQVAASAQELAVGTSSQSEASDRMSNSIHNVSNMADTNAVDSKAAMEAIDNFSAMFNKCNENMGSMANAMGDINQSSNDISQIIKVIENIAFQTNILALNAAVEASRAGQAGKGFSVVAEEVRNLSIQCSDAAKQTTSLIEKSNSRVHEGVSISNEISQELKFILDNFSEISNKIKNISSASAEQAGAAKEIVSDIENINQTIQSNASASQEIAASCEELSSHSNTMYDLIKNFKI